MLSWTNNFRSKFTRENTCSFVRRLIESDQWSFSHFPKMGYILFVSFPSSESITFESKVNLKLDSFKKFTLHYMILKFIANKLVPAFNLVVLNFRDSFFQKILLPFNCNFFCSQFTFCFSCMLSNKWFDYFFEKNAAREFVLCGCKACKAFNKANK